MKARHPIFCLIRSIIVLICVAVWVACDLNNQDKPEESEGPYYRLMATGFGEPIEFEWGYVQYYYVTSNPYSFVRYDPPRYNCVYLDEYHEEEWAELEIPEQEIRHGHPVTTFGLPNLYVRASNAGGTPVAARIMLIDALSAESLLKEASGNGIAEAVAQIGMDSTAANSYSGYAGGFAGIANKVICAELHRQGLMDDTIFEADEAFGRYLRNEHEDVLMGYHVWARPLVKGMQRSKAVTKLVNLVAKPWSYEMAHVMGARDRGSAIGRILMSVGFPACRIIGRVARSGRSSATRIASIVERAKGIEPSSRAW